MIKLPLFLFLGRIVFAMQKQLLCFASDPLVCTCGCFVYHPVTRLYAFGWPGEETRGDWSNTGSSTETSETQGGPQQAVYLKQRYVQNH